MGGLCSRAGSEAVNRASHLPLRAPLPNCSLSQLCGGGSGSSSGWHTGSASTPAPVAHRPQPVEPQPPAPRALWSHQDWNWPPPREGSPCLLHLLEHPPAPAAARDPHLGSVPTPGTAGRRAPGMTGTCLAL
ncbi:hypothetical protein AV530_015222 [Patagioenas fasciata monilis]|uniref:Uncharacterized protein n=1 Tax=Patagioenas fasciata monilis TaxID=372326 RepID=A0A1V4K316_PATFA|nr:hypothetical protein AV530_015222 [Patagioenas fasciata monilis]